MLFLINRYSLILLYANDHITYFYTKILYQSICYKVPGLYNNVVFNYTILNIVLLLADDYLCDLGFAFSHNLNPLIHNEHVCCKALKMLGLIKRVSGDFNLITSLKSL